MEDKKNIRERAFIYGYRDINRDMIVYVGSSHATKNKKGMNDEELLEQVDMWHRKTGEAKFLKSVKNGGPYAYTDWRRKLQFQFSDYAEDNWVVEILHEPKDMTAEEHLTLEGDTIVEYQSKGEALLNQDTDPLKSAIKFERING